MEIQAEVGRVRRYIEQNGSDDPLGRALNIPEY
jgi:hypothetical protein